MVEDMGDVDHFEAATGQGQVLADAHGGGCDGLGFSGAFEVGLDAEGLPAVAHKSAQILAPPAPHVEHAKARA